MVKALASSWQVAVLTAVGVVVVGSIALGSPAGGSSQLTTSRPDPVSASITDLGTADLPARVTLCYDQTVNAVNFDGGSALNDQYLQGYDNGDVLNPESAPVIDPNNQNCVQLEFGTGPPAAYPRAVVLYTVACSTLAAVNGAPAGTPPKPSTQGCVTLDGSAVTPRHGQVAGPNLVATSVDSTNNRITYVFDRALDNTFCPGGSLSGTGCPQSFGYYDSTGTGGSGGQHNGDGILSNTTNQVVVQFSAADNVGDAVRYFAYSTVRSRTQDELNQTEHLGGPTTVPDLIRATLISPNTVRLEYDRVINTGGAGCAFVSAYTEDGSLHSCTSFARPNETGEDGRVLNVSFSGAQGFNSKLVRIVDEGCAVLDLESNGCSTVTRIGIRATRQGPGFTDGPDLRGVILDSGSNTGTFRFDEDVNDAGAYFPAAASFALVDNNGNLSFPPSGSTAAVDGRDVTVQFTGAQLAGAVGATVFDCSVFDFEGKAGLDADCNPIGAVGLPIGEPVPGEDTSSTGGGPGTGDTTGTATTTGSGTTFGPTTTGVFTTGPGTSTSSGQTTRTVTTTTTGDISGTTGNIVLRANTRVQLAARCRRFGRVVRCDVAGSVNRRAAARVAQAGCGGRVVIQVKYRPRRSISRSALVSDRTCRFRKRMPGVARSRVGRTGRLTIFARFRGNTHLRPSQKTTVARLR